MKSLPVILGALLGLASSAFAGMPVRVALGMIETGADKEIRCAADRKRGKNREVTRYQILPGIFHRYTRSRDYSNPELAWSVARRILEARAQWFQSRAGRPMTDVDLYLMWNAPGLYQRAGFRPERVPAQIRLRAERFANLRSEAGADSDVAGASL